MSSPPQTPFDLSPAKRELLAVLLEKELKPRAAPTVSRSPSPEIGALSFSQERLWFLARLAPGLPAYNVARAWRLTGSLNREALAQSLRTVVERHEIFNARFPDVEGQPIQRMAPAQPVDFPIVDCPGLDDEQKEAAALRFVDDAARRPFDLAAGPLFRASLLRLGETDHVLLFTTHHIVFDGWSTTVVVKELGTLYDAFSTGRQAALPVLPIRYADFVQWERTRFASEERGSLEYWTQQLAGAPELTSLPTDRPRPANPSSRGARYKTLLPGALIDDLRALSRRHGATLFITMLAAFDALLHGYTGDEDIVVGLPIANRPIAELEGVVGRFANILPLRATLQGDPPFVELLARVKENALGAYAHQDVPFEKIVDELHPRRVLSHSPIIQVSVGLQSPSALALSGLTATPLDTFSGHAKFDLSLTLMESAGQLAASFEFRADLFDGETIVRMAAHFQRILEAVVRNPEQRLSDLPSCPDVGRQLTVAPSLGSGAPDGAERPDQQSERPATTRRRKVSGPDERDDSLEAELAAIWKVVLGAQVVDVDDNFFDVGGTSLLAVMLVARIQKRCGVALTPAVLFEAPTVARLARWVRERGGVAPWSTLVAIQPNGSLPPLFCVHGGGGNVVGYADLARHLGPDQPVYGVQAIGLNADHAPHTNLHEMAAHYVNEITTLQARGPYYLSGLSFGGVVAFEMARQLEARGEQVALLALFDTSRPGHRSSFPRRVQLSNYARRASYHVGQLLRGPNRRDYVTKKLRTARRRFRERTWHLAYLPYKMSGRTLPRILHQVGSSNRAALRGYTPKPYAGRVTLFLARERAIELHRSSDLGWSTYALGGVEIHEVAGDHVSLIVEPAVGVLAAQLRTCLERARISHSTEKATSVDRESHANGTV